jgi:hypothetical protein
MFTLLRIGKFSYLCIDMRTVICSSVETCLYPKVSLKNMHDQTVVSKALSFNVLRYDINHFLVMLRSCIVKQDAIVLLF